MPRFKVDPDQVLELVEALRAANADIESDLARLDAQVRHLQGAWTGEARDAYSRAQAQWHRELADMNGVLGDAARRTTKVSARYLAAHQAVAKRWGSA